MVITSTSALKPNLRPSKIRTLNNLKQIQTNTKRHLKLKRRELNIKRAFLIIWVISFHSQKFNKENPNFLESILKPTAKLFRPQPSHSKSAKTVSQIWQSRNATSDKTNVKQNSQKINKSRFLNFQFLRKINDS